MPQAATSEESEMSINSQESDHRKLRELHL